MSASRAEHFHDPWLMRQIVKAGVPMCTLGNETEPLGSLREDVREERLGDTSWDALVWFDDDDYQHPDRVQRQIVTLEAHPDAPYTAFTAAHFFDMKTGMFCPFESGGAAPLALTMLRRHVVEAIEFDVTLGYGEDTDYMRRVEAKFGPGVRIRDPYMVAFGCHPFNVSREARERMVFSIPLSEVREAYGWTEADDVVLAETVARFPHRLGRSA